MPRSSETVAALGGALAKAQAELVNPEKTLIATVPISRAREGEERTFRYASLASGLDIVRKTLGQHEIAAVQTTAIDQASGLVNLSTMLVHSSGEWIASDWPVCPISDLASPRRMGAALTYARRYALFTLVGIAGEDDLDAPDLQERTTPRSPAGNGLAGVGGPDPAAAGNGYGGRGLRRAGSAPPAYLHSVQSAEVRDRLIVEIADIASSEQAEHWARQALPIKNTLAVTDAQAIEQVFERRLNELSTISDDELPSAQGEGRGEPPGGPPAEFGGLFRPEDQPDASEGTAAQRPAAQEPATRESAPAGSTAVPPQRAKSYEPPPCIDKSLLALSEPKRHRNKEHLRFVAREPCLVCGRTPSDPHHLRFAQAQALGRKVSDEFVVPLCRSHHRALHRVGNELGWWKTAGIEPLEVARKLWAQTQLIEQVEPIPDPVVSEAIRPDADLQIRPDSPALGTLPAKRPRKNAAAANGRTP